MKRAYADLSDRERRARAEDEAFFDMAFGPTRLDVMCFFGTNGLTRIPFEQLGAAARRWLTDRGLAPQEVAS